MTSWISEPVTARRPDSCSSTCVALGPTCAIAPSTSRSALFSTVLDTCAVEMPWLDAEGVVAEYADGIRWLGQRDSSRQKLVLLLGSNIGNLDDVAAQAFFSSLRQALRDGDHVLVGFDLLKDPKRLCRAYDDSAGVTAEFNLNLLRRINRELAANFEVSSFRHYATFSPARRAMESYLVSTRRQSVEISGKPFDFAAWEPVHTEISRKYREAEVTAFAKAAGFVEVGHFFDERRFFVDALWRVGSARTVP